MIHLDNNKTFQALLLTAVAANQPVVTVCFYDVPPFAKNDSGEYPGATKLTSMSSAAVVAICSAPEAANFIRNIEFVSLYNRDTSTVDASVRINDSVSGAFVLVRQLISPNKTLVYEDGAGWQIL